MSDTWWLQPGWTQTTCASCGRRIWPDGDPDWGYCYECFSALHEEPPTEMLPKCDICGKHPAVADVCGKGICSEACAHEAEAKTQQEEK